MTRVGVYGGRMQIWRRPTVDRSKKAKNNQAKADPDRGAELKLTPVLYWQQIWRQVSYSNCPMAVLRNSGL